MQGPHHKATAQIDPERQSPHLLLAHCRWFGQWRRSLALYPSSVDGGLALDSDRLECLCVAEFHSLVALQDRGLVEQLSYEIQRHKGIQDDRYLELDRRLQNLGTAPATASTDQTIDNEPAVDEEIAAQDQSEQSLYDAGLASIKARQFEDAIDQLKRLIEQYPDGEFTANAYYWIGEVHAAMPQPDYEQARQALVQVIDGFPGNNKVPDASFKLGKVYHLMGDCSRAKAFLQQVATSYASKSAGQLAERYLANQIDC